MEKLIKVIIEIYHRLTKHKGIQFRFFVYNGMEQSNQIKIANSVEYRFINQGTSIVYINNALKLYPMWSGIAPYEITLHGHKNEFDETIYEYTFKSYADQNDYVAALTPLLPTGFRNDVVTTGLTVAKASNKLLVIVKQRSAIDNKLSYHEYKP